MDGGVLGEVRDQRHRQAAGGHQEHPEDGAGQRLLHDGEAAEERCPSAYASAPTAIATPVGSSRRWCRRPIQRPR
ncbi:hypothetical protein ACFQ0M_49955 [Kitasatospora aburaviensis]